MCCSLSRFVYFFYISVSSTNVLIWLLIFCIIHFLSFYSVQPQKMHFFVLSKREKWYKKSLFTESFNAPHIYELNLRQLHKSMVIGNYTKKNYYNRSITQKYYLIYWIVLQYCQNCDLILCDWYKFIFERPLSSALKTFFCSFSDDLRNQKPLYLIDCYLYKCHVLNIKPTTYTNVDHFNELENKKNKTQSQYI